ncbi:MAG: TatD family hydrolase [Gammaproteobacteria bacterium]|nr:TatD family hydrolase [Gammaproteobacteria bacterium]NND59307.1 hydrolase TatD [Gammaproteobacteria bacterium]
MPETNAVELIDIGANLTHDSFDHDRDRVLERARAVGVVQQVITGTSVDGSRIATELARQYSGELYATAGMHPHHASDFDDDARRYFAELAADEVVVAIGECGLDFYRNFSPHADQERAFVEQLEIAVGVQLPVFLHQRDAHDPFLSIMRDYRDRLPAAVAHCFTGDRKQAREYLDLDMHIGITGWFCDERRGQALRDAALYIPAERMMIETDAPYLLPRDLRPRPKSRRNEPMHLAHILHELALHRGDEPKVLAAATTANARRFFSLPAANDMHQSETKP